MSFVVFNNSDLTSYLLSFLTIQDQYHLLISIGSKAPIDLTRRLITTKMLRKMTRQQKERVDGLELSGKGKILPKNLKMLRCLKSYGWNVLPELPKTLLYLDCGNNSSIHTLPTELPPSLEVLICENVYLGSLPKLPKTLKRLFCNNNILERLPELPEGLITLNCERCFYKVGGDDEDDNYFIIPTLPSTLEFLDCSGNSLNSLPKLPESLEFLLCKDNYMSALPELPDSLTDLDCDNNIGLTVLPQLPKSLLYLNIDSCQSLGRNLPPLPEGLIKLSCWDTYIDPYGLPSSLEVLKCGLCRIDKLEPLPVSLTYLSCEQNHLKEIPTLPPCLTFLSCGNNPELGFLPELPHTLIVLLCRDTSIQNIPTLPIGFCNLDCSYNEKLKSLPYLPEGTKTLDCIGCTNISPYPSSLPSSLKKLNCSPCQSMFMFQKVSGDVSITRNELSPWRRKMLNVM